MVHGPSARFQPLAQEQLHNLSVPELLNDAEEIHVWFKPKCNEGLAAKANRNSLSWFGESASGNASFKTKDAALAASCHKSGGSLYFGAPPAATELLVTALAQQLGLSFAALFSDGSQRSTVETFASRAGNVTAWHYDFMENFTLQLAGTKTWWVKPSGVHVPHRSCTPQQATAGVVAQLSEQQAKQLAQHALPGFQPTPPDASFWDDAVEVKMAPGDVLYVPAGYWHRVACTSDSISVNISLMASCWADLIADALRQRLLCHTPARAPACMESVIDGRRQLKGLLDLAPVSYTHLTLPTKA